LEFEVDGNLKVQIVEFVILFPFLFVFGSQFLFLNFIIIAIESGNDIFVLENGFLIDIVHQKLIRNLSKSSILEIIGNIEILGSKCFLSRKSLSSMTFESNSRLTRIESGAFAYSSLESILLPSTILFMASDVLNIDSPLVFGTSIDGNSCPQLIDGCG
jgi:hypothetical protein